MVQYSFQIVYWLVTNRKQLNVLTAQNEEDLSEAIANNTLHTKVAQCYARVKTSQRC